METRGGRGQSSSNNVAGKRGGANVANHGTLGSTRRDPLVSLGGDSSVYGSGPQIAEPEFGVRACPNCEDTYKNM